MAGSRNFLRVGILAVSISALLSGCGTIIDAVHGVRDAAHGAPRINDNVFMMRNGGAEDPDAAIPAVIPRACRPPGVAANNTFDAKIGDVDLKKVTGGSNPDYSENDIEEYAYSLKQGEALDKCVAAMKLLVDTRWAHFEHVLNASLSTSNFFVDATVTGLATSIPLVANGTKNVLGAIAAGLSGTRKDFDEDILYSYSIQTILQQMRTDRAAEEAVIVGRLYSQTHPYRNMYEAADDLFAYDQAGSWDHGMASLQANIAAQTAACQSRLRDEKISFIKGTDLPNGQPFPSTGGSMFADPCTQVHIQPSLNNTQLVEAENGIKVSFATGTTLANGEDVKISDAIAIAVTGAYDVTVTGTTTPGDKLANGTMANNRANFVQGKIQDGLKTAGTAGVNVTIGTPTDADLSSVMGAKITFVAKAPPNNNG